MKTLRSLACLLALAHCLPAFADRNVILLIGDGMDDQQITIARNYLAGARGKLTLDTMPVRGVSQVLTVSEDGKPVYVADSANTATAMATGVVTSRGRVATTAGDDQPIPTIIQQAQARGFRTGIIATSSVTDATPASFVAHMNRRFCEGPATMNGVSYGLFTMAGCPGFTKASGGPGSIAEQIAASQVDVILGGGLEHFEQAAEGSEQSVLQLARDSGFQVATTWMEAAHAPVTNRLLGLFAPVHLPVRLRGEDGRPAEPAEPNWANRVSKYIGDVSLPEPMTCEPNPAFADTPSLQQMTELALVRLRNEQGFFLVIESASIDKKSHERRPCGSIGELDQLDEALQSALAFAAENPDTLIIVTADHAQAAQLVPAESLFAAYGVPVYSPGRLARIQTPEGAVLAVNYATNNFSHEEHTGANVPVFANSEGEGRVPTMLTQPDIYHVMRDYLALD